MAKLGRYSADRKKVESLTADKTVEVSDCGTIFVLNLAAGGIDVTLPAVADAGQGWWIKVLCGTTVTGTANHTIVEDTGSDTDILITQINELETDTTEDGPSSTGHTTITFNNGSTPKMTKGDFVEIVCDGTNFYCHGQVALDAVAECTA
jgi:hypothetical protein